MKAIPRIISKVYSEPWLITDAQHRAIRQALAAHLTNVDSSEDSPGVLIEREDPEQPYERRGSVAVICVEGILGKRLDWIESMCGGFDIDDLCEALKVADKDPLISQIAIDFNTPGGTVTGIPEAGELIVEINTRKPVTAFTETQCTSGGAWLASQCGSFYVTGSSCNGSIGVYTAFLDESAAMEMEGLKMNAMAAGRYKLAGASWKPMTDEERALFQSQVDAIHAQFKAAVWSNHPNVPEEAMDGQTFDGLSAESFGLADGVVRDLDELLTKLTQPPTA